MNPPSREVDADEERDAALIDRLYGDDAPGSDDELGDFRAVRALVARVREEAPVAEPSPAIAATLLAAARERAPKEGLWARFVAWMSPVTSHPALAAAATLVVVAGAAALWMRGGGEVAEPKRDGAEVRRESEAQTADRNAPDPEPATESFETGGVIAEPPAEEVAKDAPAPKGARPPRAEPPEKPARTKPDTDNRLKEEKELEAKSEVKKADAPVVVTGRVDGQVGGGDSGGFAGGGSTSGGEADKKKKAPAKDEAPPPPAPPPAMDPSPADDAGGDEDAPEVTGTAQDRAPSTADQARAVTRKARAEAEKDNCKNTSSYGTQVSNLDRGVYDKEFVRDRFIDACLRRARSKSKPTTTKSGE